jgi:WD40 repeat protein
VTSLAVSHSSRLVASRSDDGAVDLWEPIGGSVERSARGGALASGLAIALSPDGAMLAACEGGGDYGIRLTQLRSGGQRALRGHTAAVTCLAFSRDGAFLVSGSRDHTVRIWAPRPQLLIHTLGGLAGRVTAVALSPDSALVAAGGDDEVISVWQLETGAQIHILRLPDRPQVARARRLRLAFSPDGAVLAVGFEHSTPLLYSLDSRTPPRSLIRAASPVECLAFSPNGTLLAIASGATVEIWDPVTSEQLTTLEGHAGTINDIAFSARGCLLSASNDCTIRLWNVEDALSEARPPCAATLAASRHGWIAIARDGRYKVGGEITGELGFGVGLCRFEVGELDDFPEAFAQPPRRIPDDEPLLVAGRDVLW